MGRFTRTREGIRVRLSPPEVELLTNLSAELRAVYETSSTDEVRRRLFPRAYLDPTEESAEAQWRALVEPELMAERLDALTALAATLERGRERRSDVEVVLVGDESAAWLGVLNDARLALGTRLGVTDDVEELVVGDDPETIARQVYDWLTWLQGDLVEVLLPDLPG